MSSPGITQREIKEALKADYQKRHHDKAARDESINALVSNYLKAWSSEELGFVKTKRGPDPLKLNRYHPNVNFYSVNYGFLFYYLDKEYGIKDVEEKYVTAIRLYFENLKIMEHLLDNYIEDFSIPEFLISSLLSLKYLTWNEENDESFSFFMINKDISMKLVKLKKLGDVVKNDNDMSDVYIDKVIDPIYDFLEKYPNIKQLNISGDTKDVNEQEILRLQKLKSQL